MLLETLSLRVSYRFVVSSVLRFHKIRGTVLAVPIVRIIVFWDLYCDPPIQGNYLTLKDLQANACWISRLPKLECMYIELT